MSEVKLVRSFPGGLGLEPGSTSLRVPRVDQKHKTLRSFYCEDSLWEMFEVMTRDLDCSMDYLINESMRHYARSRNYSLTGMSRMRQPEPSYRPQQGYAPAPPQRPTIPMQGGGVQADSRTIPLSAYNPQGAEWTSSAQGYPAYRQPSPPRPTPPPPPPTSAPSYGGGGYAEPSIPRQPPAPPLSPQQRGRGPHGVPVGRHGLFLFFNGQRYLIDKDRFIIGRGSQNTDLTIRDGNISRKHAAVIYHDGAYYLQDLGSTNGIEYKNAKVASKQIEEGDLFNICDYELRFSYVG